MKPMLNPEILQWARKTAGLSLEEAAHALDLKEAYGTSGPDRLAALEAGKEEPSRPLLLRMAKRYRRSLLVFYLEQPPKAGDRGKDFRTLPRTEALYNPVLDALLRDIRGRQGIIKSLLEDSEVEKLPFIGSATVDLPVSALAERITKQLGFNLSIFRSQAKMDEAFAYLRLRTEASRIFVLLLGNLGTHHTNISLDAFRGFALADQIAPLVVINDNDAVSAWSFTALHEVAHLWLGATGVSGSTAGLAIEQYCSDVAAEILLPPRELEEFARVGNLTRDRLAERVSQFADKRNISRAMVAYRIFRTGAITEKTWEDLRERFYKDWVAHKEREALKQKVREGGPSYYVVRRHRIGKALLALTNRSLGEGVLTYTKAARLLGVKARNVDPLLASFSRGGE
jgi:Zn-dependent peptidase ImmA (M78 family)/transcriptional regulator with XRE-family HTH domain